MGHGVRSPAAGALSLVHDRERLAPRLAALQRVSRPPTFPLIAAILGLFLGSGAVGVAMAGALAPGSRLAEAVSLFALPFAFAVGLQAWYGLALLSLVPRLVRWLVGGCVPALPGAFVFVPLSSCAGALAGIVSGSRPPPIPPGSSPWRTGSRARCTGSSRGGSPDGGF